VVETNVHYPTDINLLFDAMRKVIALIAQLCQFYGFPGWRQSAYQVRQLKQLFRTAQTLKRSTSKDDDKKAARQKLIEEAHQAYLDYALTILQRVDFTLEGLCQYYFAQESELAEVKHYMAHANRQIDQIKTRVIDGKPIPHEEKVFSIFEEHTEWISKGKAGVPQELGLKVCMLEDQFGFILHHQVMQKMTDEQVAVPMVKAAQQKFKQLDSCSFDKGFHSPQNQKDLPTLLNLVVLPKKGKRSSLEQRRENQEDFIQLRHQHSAVESAINALENHGLDRCPDHGLHGFQRYVSLAVLGRNLQILGNLIQQKQFKIEQKQQKLKKVA